MIYVKIELQPNIRLWQWKLWIKLIFLEHRKVTLELRLQNAQAWLQQDKKSK